MGAWEDGFAAGWRAALGTGFPESFSPYAERDARRASKASIRAPYLKLHPKRKRAPSAYNKRLGTAIRRINKRAKKKDGDYRKGWSRSKVFKMAHKEARRR